MKNKIIFSLIIVSIMSCGPSIAYGDYINSEGMTRKQIEAIKDHPQVQIGIASYYGSKFHKKRTANGEIFNMYKVSAAHKTLPLGTKVRVINLKNGRSLTMTINERGPYVKGRDIELTYKAAQKLGFVNQGTTKVRIEVLRLGDNKYHK